MLKAKNTFIDILAIVSILGFLSIFLSVYTSLNIGPYTTALILVLLGIGLMIEGNVRTVGKMLKNGLTRDEITHIIAIVIGLFSAIVGFLSFPFIGITNPTFEATKGMIAFLAIIIIAVETWLVE